MCHREDNQYRSCHMSMLLLFSPCRIYGGFIWFAVGQSGGIFSLMLTSFLFCLGFTYLWRCSRVSLEPRDWFSCCEYLWVFGGMRTGCVRPIFVDFLKAIGSLVRQKPSFPRHEITARLRSLIINRTAKSDHISHFHWRGKHALSSEAYPITTLS